MNAQIYDEEIFLSDDFSLQTSCYFCKSDQLEEIGSTSTIHPRSRFGLSIIRCLNCDHWHTNPMPKPELLSRLYAQASLSVEGADLLPSVDKVDTVSATAPDDHWIVKALCKYPPGNFLEIGPGKGALLRKMRSLGWNSFGVELATYKKGFQVVSSLGELPDSIQFDVIVFQDVLEHIPNPSPVLNDYLRFLSPSALLFMSVPWSESKRARYLKATWEMVRPLGHLHYFSKESSRSLLKSSGFEVLAIEAVNINRGYMRDLAAYTLSFVHGLLPSKWRTLDTRTLRLIRYLALFPGDSVGDQLYVRAKLASEALQKSS